VSSTTYRYPRCAFDSVTKDLAEHSRPGGLFYGISVSNGGGSGSSPVASCLVGPAARWSEPQEPAVAPENKAKRYRGWRSGVLGISAQHSRLYSEKKRQRRSVTRC
jgi:hypothetical protein